MKAKDILQFITLFGVILLFEGCGKSRPWIKFATKDTFTEIINEEISQAHESSHELAQNIIGAWYSDPTNLKDDKIVLPFIVYGATYYLRGDYITIEKTPSSENEQDPKPLQEAGSEHKANSKIDSTVESSEADTEKEYFHYFHIHSYGKFGIDENYLHYKHIEGCKYHVGPPALKEKVLDINKEELIFNEEMGHSTSFKAKYFHIGQNNGPKNNMMIGCFQKDLNDHFIDLTDYYKDLLEEDIIEAQKQYDKIEDANRPPFVPPHSMFELIKTLPNA